MKKLSFPILLCALVGLTSMFLPNGEAPSMFRAFWEFDRFRLALMVAAFAVPAGLSLYVLSGKPVRSWHAMVTMAAFAIAVVKSQVWTVVAHISDLYLPMMLQASAIVLGAIVSVIAFANEREAEATS